LIAKNLRSANRKSEKRPQKWKEQGIAFLIKGGKRKKGGAQRRSTPQRINKKIWREGGEKPRTKRGEKEKAPELLNKHTGGPPSRCNSRVVRGKGVDLAKPSTGPGEGKQKGVPP